MPKEKSTVSAVASVQPTSIKDIEVIKRHEGLRLTAYKPTANDVWTIGYGHTKTAKQGMKITEAGADALLRQDLDWVEEVLNRLVKVPLTQNQYDALASLVFNIGEGQFKTSSVLRRLNDKDYKGAADAFLMWNKQRNKRTGQLEELKGLTRRRTEERAMFLGEQV